MRRIFSSPAIWLSASVLAHRASSQQTHTPAVSASAENRFVFFTVSPNNGDGTSTYHADPGSSKIQNFSYNLLSAGLTIVSVSWTGYDGTQNITLGRFALSDSVPAGQSTTKSPSLPAAATTQAQVGGRRDAVGIRHGQLLDVQRDTTPSTATDSTPFTVSSLSATSGTITVRNTAFADGQAAADFLSKLMWLTLEWTGNGMSGSSSSKYFTFVPPAQDESGLTGDIIKALQSSGPAMPETSSGALSTASQGGGVNPTVNPSATVTSSVSTATSSATDGATDGNMGGTGVSGPSRALSNGAIAGIAVGCGLAALLAIGALVWCLLRRRRAAGASPVPNGYDNRTQELIAQKEASAGVSDAVPHSPYSDDDHNPAGGMLRRGAGGPQQQHLVAADAAGPAAGAVSTPYTPYSDHGRDSMHAAAGEPGAGAYPPHTRSDSASGARSPTPPGISTRYAHLVEEGMTEAEIRRLEEEERHLDAAIEEAGHH